MLQEAEQPKQPSAVEEPMDELGAGIAQFWRTTGLIKSVAVAEQKRGSQLFSETAATLQGFKKEVLGFMELREATMLNHSQGDLQWWEE
ncbi:hypothetical protein QTO34_012852 [Cnephaeus nilssonii]|uniref:Uncharacterized protein n=1 Tax=Cnephaeus nilssonii TaxID=3371016 RepID=A0AA40LD63_CNENI|nr:hypothetical protein QTO34_012852 [Eptesicus nilssonii]